MPSHAEQLSSDTAKGNANRPWLIPETFEQQNELLRFQVDPEGETVFQRNYAFKIVDVEHAKANNTEKQIELDNKKLDNDISEKEKDFQRHKELLEIQHLHRMDLDRVASRKRRLDQFLVSSTWNKDCPADWKQAVAITLNAILIPMSRKTCCIAVSVFLLR